MFLESGKTHLRNRQGESENPRVHSMGRGGRRGVHLIPCVLLHEEVIKPLRRRLHHQCLRFLVNMRCQSSTHLIFLVRAGGKVLVAECVNDRLCRVLRKTCGAQVGRAQRRDGCGRLRRAPPLTLPVDLNSTTAEWRAASSKFNRALTADLELS